MTERPPLVVLLIGNFLSAAGGSRGVCEELAVRLPSAGCSVMTTSSKKRKLDRLMDMVGTAWRQRKRYAVAQVDVFSGPAFIWAEAACGTLRAARKPYVLTLHGGNLPVFTQGRRGRVERLLRSAAAVTTPSRYLLNAFSWCRSDIQFIPNGLDLRSYATRQSHGARPSLVWLRAFHRIYNPSLAVRVVHLLAPRFPDIRLTMVGADKGDGALQEAVALASSLGVSNRVQFLGAVPKPEVPRVLGSRDIFLNTSNIDNAPVSVIEAMACGLCVVSTNVGGMPDLVDDGRDALLVPPDDPDRMAGAVTKILDDPDLADRLSQAGRRKAERFDWPPIVSQWRTLLAAMAERHAA